MEVKRNGNRCYAHAHSCCTDGAHQFGGWCVPSSSLVCATLLASTGHERALAREIRELCESVVFIVSAVDGS